MGRIKIYIVIWGVFLVAAYYHHILPYIIPVWYSQQHTFLEDRVSCLPFLLSTLYRVLHREALQNTFAEQNWSRVIKEAVTEYRKESNAFWWTLRFCSHTKRRNASGDPRRKVCLSELCRVEENAAYSP